MRLGGETAGEMSVQQVAGADGAELEQNVKAVFNLEPSLIPRLKEVLK